MLEKILRLSRKSLALSGSPFGNKPEDGIGKVDETDVLWQEMTWNALRCVQSSGFYFETQETPPPFRDVQFGRFYEVTVRDSGKEYYEVLLSKYHYPGDVGETLVLQLSQPVMRGRSNIHVNLTVRNNVGKINFSPDFLVIRDSFVSKGVASLTSEEKLNILKTLCGAYVDVPATQELFEQRAQEGRAVFWMKDRPVGLLDIPG